jgi:hypothetical protein
MAQAADNRFLEADRGARSLATSPTYQAYQILHLAFFVAPVIAGVDKFLNLLTHWEQYLAPVVTKVIPLSPRAFMMGVGAIEIAAGLLVLAKPRYFAYVVAAWLVGIIVNLILLGAFFDVALRDLGLALGALALGRLAQTYDVEEPAAA